MGSPDANRQLLETVAEWLRSVELRALDPEQLGSLLLIGAQILDGSAPLCRRLWVRLAVTTAASVLREEAQELAKT